MENISKLTKLTTGAKIQIADISAIAIFTYINERWIIKGISRNDRKAFSYGCGGQFGELWIKKKLS